MKIFTSHRKNKKYFAIFDDGTITHFGDSRYEDYTQHHDVNRRTAYIKRHSNEDYSDPRTAGSLSRFILWGDSTDINRNIRSFKSRYRLK